MQLFQILVVCLIAVTSDANATENGFEPLVKDTKLTGWIGEGKKHCRVEKGVLICQKGSYGNLLTEKEYADFVLRFEFRLTPGANNGLAIRTAPEGDAAYVGIELQILDNTAEKYQQLQPYQYHGSAYGIAPAKRGALKPVGEWNTQEVVCRGRKIHVTLNKQEILNIDLDQAAPDNRTIDGKPHPGLSRQQGHLGFLCHGDEVWFRNVRVQEIKDSRAAAE